MAHTSLAAIQLACFISVETTLYWTVVVSSRRNFTSAVCYPFARRTARVLNSSAVSICLQSELHFEDVAFTTLVQECTTLKSVLLLLDEIAASRSERQC